MSESAKRLIYVYAAVPFPADHLRTLRPQHPVGKKVGEPSRTNRVVLGLGKPIEPTKAWTCDTDLTWPVLEANGIPVKPIDNAMPFVCRHQIEAVD